jgi:hypothetical protein
MYQMRNIARLLAITLPRQFGPNSYTAPFLVQAYSKGLFNIQLGIVSSLSIRRSGNGGESHSVYGIPMELEVTLVIKDLYNQFSLSNEYKETPYGILGDVAGLFTGSGTTANLIMNNIGLLDFVASYSGYNINSPETERIQDYITNIGMNNLIEWGLAKESSSGVEFNFLNFKDIIKSPAINRLYLDKTRDIATKYNTFSSV